MIRTTAIIMFLCAAACTSPPVNRSSDLPLTTVESVEIDQYLGLWYEIARYPNSFEKGCEGVTAEYALRGDGLLSVVNSCRKNGLDGKLQVATGRAKVVDQSSNAKLKVSFFGPFWGDYWIIDLADDYSLSLVGEPKGKYLWILSRTPTISDDVKADALAKLQSLGYDTSALYFTMQSGSI